MNEPSSLISVNSGVGDKPMAVSDPVGTISKLSVQGGFLRLLKDDTDY